MHVRNVPVRVRKCACLLHRASLPYAMRLVARHFAAAPITNLTSFPALALMIRRKLALLALAAATLALSACADTTAPRQEEQKCVNQQGSGLCTK